MLYDNVDATSTERDNPMSMQNGVMTITPEVAEQLLENNTSNRPIRPRHVASLKRLMKSGKWYLNGDTITVTENGRLIDGQHRLTACVELGKPFDSHVAIIPAATPRKLDLVFLTKDSGKRRTAADFFYIKGYPCRTTLSSVARMLYFWERGTFDGHIDLVPQDLEDVVRRHKGVVESSRWTCSQNELLSLIGPSAPAMCHYLFGIAHPRKRDEFFTAFATGVDLHDGHPVLALRRALLRAKARRADGRGRNGVTKGYGGRWWAAALIVKAWNAFIGERDLSIIRWAQDKGFPDIQTHAGKSRLKQPKLSSGKGVTAS